MKIKNLLNSAKTRVRKFISNHMKLSRITAAVLAFGLIIGVAVFVNPLLGYPLSTPFYRLKAKNYIKENYGDMGYVMVKFQDFHDGQYFATAARPGSIDDHFMIDIHSNILIHDGYESDVLQCGSVRTRLMREYEALADTVLKSPRFPYELRSSSTQLSIGRGGIPRPNRLSEDILEIDGIYDIRELGSQAGYLEIYVYSDEKTVEKAAEILLEIDRLMTKGGVTYFAIDLRLMEPEDKLFFDDFGVSNFRRSDIYEEGLVERIAKAALG